MSGNHSPDAVRELAHRLWQERGGVGGSPHDDWLRAEAMLNDEHRATLQDTALDQVTGQFTGQGVDGATPHERRQATEKVDRTVEDSFPASDPPAVHIKDEPPANAGDKWKAAKDAKRKGAAV
jgi:DUF2934 family protein